MKELNKEQLVELQKYEDALDALEFLYYEGNKKDQSLKEAISALQLVAENLLASKYMKTMGGEYPNSNGVYDENGVGVEVFILPAKTSALNMAEIRVVQLENKKWIGRIGYDIDNGGGSTPLMEDNKVQFDTKEKAVSYFASVLYDLANKRKIIFNPNEKITHKESADAKKVMAWASDLNLKMSGVKLEPAKGSEYPEHKKIIDSFNEAVSRVGDYQKDTLLSQIITAGKYDSECVLNGKFPSGRRLTSSEIVSALTDIYEATVRINEHEKNKQAEAKPKPTPPNSKYKVGDVVLFEGNRRIIKSIDTSDNTNSYWISSDGGGQMRVPENTVEPDEKQIIKEDEYNGFKFTDETIEINEAAFVNYLRNNPYANRKVNKLTLEKDGATKFSIINKDGSPSQAKIKNLVELSVMLDNHSIASDTSLTRKERYDKIVELYKSQFNLSHRSSDSVFFNQYSTPATLGFVMSMYCGISPTDNSSVKYFEPSAGTGMLTITGDPSNFDVNEYEPYRAKILRSVSAFTFCGIECNSKKSQHHKNLHYINPYNKVTTIDASEPDKFPIKMYDAVISNPPFGKAEYVRKIDGFKISKLDHVMAVYALDTMKDDGRAAIIIGGNHNFDESGRLGMTDYVFFNYLSSRYNLEDVINIDGSVFYAKMGTSFNTRIILINGRRSKPQEIWFPVEDKTLLPEESFAPHKVSDFNVLFNRVNNLIK